MEVFWRIKIYFAACEDLPSELVGHWDVLNSSGVPRLAGSDAIMPRHPHI